MRRQVRPRAIIVIVVPVASLHADVNLIVNVILREEGGLALAAGAVCTPHQPLLDLSIGSFTSCLTRLISHEHYFKLTLLRFSHDTSVHDVCGRGHVNLAA